MIYKFLDKFKLLKAEGITSIPSYYIHNPLHGDCMSNTKQCNRRRQSQKGTSNIIIRLQYVSWNYFYSPLN